MDYVAGMDPLKYLGSYARSGGMNTSSRSEGVKNFATIFYSEMLKQVFSAQSWSTEEDKGSMFGDLTPMTEVFADKFAQELVKSGKYDELIAKQMLMKGSAKWL